MFLRYLFVLCLLPTFLWSQEPSKEKKTQEVVQLAKEAQSACEAAEAAKKEANRQTRIAEEAIRCCRPFKDYLHSFYLYSQLEIELEVAQKRYQEQKLQPHETLDNLASQIEDLQRELKEEEAVTNSKRLHLAEYIAIKSTRMENMNSQALFAKEACYLNSINEEYPQNHLVYAAIYKAFNRLKEANRELGFNTFNQFPKGRDRIGRFRHIQIDKTSEKIYTIGADGLLLKWDFDSYGNKKTTKPSILSNNVSVSRALDRSPDGKYLAIGGDGDSILIYEMETGQLSKKLPREGNRLWALQYTSNGDGIISAEDVSAQNGFKATTLYYTNMKAESTPIIANIPSRISSIELSSGGQYLAGIGSSSEVSIWDILNQRCILSLNGHKSDKRPTAIAFDPRGVFLAVGYQDGAIMIWDLAQAKDDSTYLPDRFFRHTVRISDLAFNQDGTLLAVGSLDKSASLWHIRDKKHLGANNHKEFPYQGISYNPIHLEDHEDWVTTVAFSPDETKIITGTADGKMKLWEIDMTQYANQMCSLIDPANKKLTYSTWARHMDAYSNDPEEEAFFLHLFTQRNKERCP